MPASTLLPDSLLLNGREFRYQDIQQYPANTPADLNGYEARVLDFCRQWLNGAQEFGLRTSGSTGKPQLVQMKRRQLEASARRTGDYFDLGPGDRMLVCLNCEFVGGIMMLVRAFERNMHLTIVEPQADPMVLVPAATFDFASFVPLQLREVLANGHGPRLNRMKAILVGGASVEKSLEKEIQKLKVPVYLTYGMTETASHIALRRLNGPSVSPYYQVLPGIHVGQDERGCLTVRADVTNDQLITTNDRVQLQPENHTFEWLGRADFVINSGGVKVQAEKVELVLEVALTELGLSRRAFVAGRPDARLGEQVTVIIEGAPLPPHQQQQLLALLTERLEKYERPREVVYVPQFKTTASGKLDRLGTMRGQGAAPHPHQR
ncbi:AMP-binding protein [Hymenobacter taeanensis]|uniref:AMP-binding protein n=1 Tax=Hymenobacter taeanensis TaxID=2735321 RepID=A0A6M6BBI6_9BACT|nr:MULTISPECIES: AMP-binding protein [Hymenobacter]QJX45507.1 AMP-binding protein [Hymenobacter taeanensis]UOQ81246.1 AMP-binding protein [Hymenobacter sp. 5414T-23]